MISQLNAYLHFDGTCEEAFTFYKKALGGEFQIVHRYDHPAIDMKGIEKQKILHAEYQLNATLLFYGCDFYPNQRIQKGNAEPALSLTFDSLTEAQHAFDQLKDGGQVLLPFGKQFWNAMHGQLIDKFGIKWMMNY